MTSRIRWQDDPETGEATGCAGTLDPAAFRIWEASEGGEWLLTSILPGHQGARTYGATPDELKAEAERWLERFVSSLGAVFPEPAYEFDEGGRPVEVIFAPGRRVRFAHPGNGYPGDAEQASRLLTVGEVYVIDWSDIGFSKTRLSLAGIDSHGQGFNSVLFEPVADQEPVPHKPEEES